jgi:endogenous inhibitor of DNA gyrase (YacG/DUF329 family)
MIRVRCPICAKSFEIKAVSDLPSFPFCSERCRLVDLGRWIDGSYVLPGQEKPAEKDGDSDQDEPPTPQ